MAELHDRLAARQRELLPHPGAFDRLVRRRRRRETGRRVAAGAVAAVLAVGLVSLLMTLRPGGAARPAITPETVSSMRVTWKAWVPRSPSAPTIAGGTVFVSADRLYAFPIACEARTTCEPLWTGDIGGSSTVPPVVGGDTVVATSGDVLTAFDTDCRHDGNACEPLWTAESPSPQLPEGGVGIDDTVALGFSEPLIDGENVIVSGPGGLYVFRLNCRHDGGPCRPAWQAEGTGSAAAPAVADGFVYVHAHGELQAFPRTCPRSHCRRAWAASVPESSRLSVTVAGDLLLVGGIGYRWNGTRLVPVWRSSVAGSSSPLSPVLVDGGVAYIPSDRLSAYPLTCGKDALACPPSWSSPARFDPVIGRTLSWSEPVAAGGLVFSSAGEPAAFIEGCGERGRVCKPVWTGQSASGTSRPALSASALVVTTSEGGIVAYVPSS